MPQSNIVFFGARKVVGHHYFTHLGDKVYESPVPCVPHIDQRFTPDGTRTQGDAALHHVNSWTILAWHDYTIDRRPGSNSVLMVKGTHSFAVMLKFLEAHFFDVFQRQPRGLNLVDAEDR